MTEFWILSNFLRQNSFENSEVHKLCKAVAARYWENEKNDLRANSAREENIILKIDVGNLRQLYAAAVEVMEAQSISEALLSEYYDEELKMAYDIDQQEKIYGYDELKTELETRETVKMYEDLHNRSIEVANKMEERYIVKKYRHKEEECHRSETECLNYERKLTAIKSEVNDVQAAIRDTILQLVKGSKELEISTTPTLLSGSMEKSQPFAPIENKTSDRIIFPMKPGLSSRLSIKFRAVKTPSAIVAPRIQKHCPIKGFDRLLQEAEILRKSIQLSPDVTPPIIVSSIISKETKAEKSRKKVTFDLVSPEKPPTEVEPQLGDIENSLEIVPPNPKKLPREKIVILEDIVIKPPGVSLPVKVQKDEDPPAICKPEVRPSKRKIEIDHVFASPPKKTCDDSDSKAVDRSNGGSNQKSFMDMFMEFSKDSTIDISSSVSVSKETVASSANESKRTVTDDVDVAAEGKGNISISFGGFEDFFASLTNKDSESNDNDDFPKGENTFDFFDGNTNTGDGGGDCANDDFSFQF